MNKQKILLIAVPALAAVLCLWFLIGGFCIGRIENNSVGLWSHIHMYMTDEITVDFPVSGKNQPIIFNYETGRGSFSVEITDADGNILYTDSTSDSGHAAFLASTNLTLRIRAKGHGGAVSLALRDDLDKLPNRFWDKYLFRGDGTHTGDTFTKTFECWKSDGKNFNFFVENKGTSPVVITINDNNPRTIPAGSSGHVSVTIAGGVLPLRMNVKCVSEDDSDLNIYWKVAQRGPSNG